MKLAGQLFLDDSGQGLVEYGLVICLVAIAAYTGLSFFGKRTGNSLSSSANTLPLD